MGRPGHRCSWHRRLSRSGAVLALIGLLISLVFSTAGARASHPGEASPSGRNDDLIVLAYHEITTPDQAVMPDYAVTPKIGRAHV